MEKGLGFLRYGVWVRRVAGQGRRRVRGIGEGLLRESRGRASVFIPGPENPASGLSWLLIGRPRAFTSRLSPLPNLL
jgi:hypothetical protein